MGVLLLGCCTGSLAAVLALFLGGGVLVALAVYSCIGVCATFGAALTLIQRPERARTGPVTELA